MDSAPKKRVAKAASKIGVKTLVKGTVRKKVVKADTAAPSTPRSRKRAVTPSRVEQLNSTVATPAARVRKNTPVPKLPTRTKAVNSLESSKSTSTTDTVTLITGSVSVRLAEKARLYRAWYERESPRLMAGIAISAGYTFVLFGTLSVFAFSSNVPLSQTKLFATLICGDVACTENTASSSSPGLVQVIPNPEVIFASSLLVEPGKDTMLEIIVRNALQHSVTTISLKNDSRRELLLEGQSSDDRYKYRIPTTAMDPGEYKTLVRVKGLNGTYSEFFGPSFRVPETPITGSGDSNQATTSPILPDPTFSNNPTEVDEDVEDPDITNDIEKKPIEPIVVLEPSREPPKLVATTTPPTPEESEESEVDDALKLALSPGVLTGQYKVQIISTYRYSSIELYARAENSTQPVFLGVAARTSDGWLYWLDGSSLPVGKYQIIARAFDASQMKETAEIRFENIPPKQTYQTEPVYTTTQEEVKQQVIEIGLSTTTPIALLVNPETPPIPTLLTSPYRTTSTPITREVETEKVQEILDTYSDELNDLLRRYGSALQSGDENLIRLTETELNNRVSELLAEEMIDSKFADSIYALEADMRRELDEVKDQIKRVEEFKKERTAAASSADTDNDGISDYDEYLLYTTDPENPDSDGDGVTDGVEISLGYDPVDEKPEAVIRFNSPKQVSYEDDSLLTINTVAPLLVYEADDTKPIVQSEISGFGLPNSFVTLYIFSDPIVVTLKTKDDGSFSYTFSKELEDGEHQVYAALTDNKGEIVVRSSAFTFVKTAEAYTYVETERETATALTEGGIVASTRSYNIVAAMGVVSFGLILLLLGATLRQERVKLNAQHV